ncbi:DUF6301 family protein [Nocardia sp. CA-151230]|uniref:DUF6301 family protein n=1 Tax=Nocardia sp. CA-151230 TaxID=3239982 RepID=UPI003D9263F0
MIDGDDFTDRLAHERTSPDADQIWPTLGYDEIMTLAARLVSLGPAWTSDPGTIARIFGWQIREPAPGLHQLDTGPGTAKGYLYWRDGRAEGLEIPVTMPVPRDDVHRLGYLFTLLSPTLAEALGRSTEASSSRRDEIVWANSDLRLTLALSATDIRLFVALKH